MKFVLYVLAGISFVVSGTRTQKVNRPRNMTIGIPIVSRIRPLLRLVISCIMSLSSYSRKPSKALAACGTPTKGKNLFLRTGFEGALSICRPVRLDRTGTAFWRFNARLPFEGSGVIIVWSNQDIRWITNKNGTPLVVGATGLFLRFHAIRLFIVIVDPCVYDLNVFETCFTKSRHLNSLTGND